MKHKKKSKTKSKGPLMAVRRYAEGGTTTAVADAPLGVINQPIVDTGIPQGGYARPAINTYLQGPLGGEARDDGNYGISYRRRADLDVPYKGNTREDYITTPVIEDTSSRTSSSIPNGSTSTPVNPYAVAVGETAKRNAVTQGNLDDQKRWGNQGYDDVLAERARQRDLAYLHDNITNDGSIFNPFEAARGYGNADATPLDEGKFFTGTGNDGIGDYGVLGDWLGAYTDRLGLTDYATEAERIEVLRNAAAAGELDDIDFEYTKTPGQSPSVLNWLLGTGRWEPNHPTDVTHSQTIGDNRVGEGEINESGIGRDFNYDRFGNIRTEIPDDVASGNYYWNSTTGAWTNKSTGVPVGGSIVDREAEAAAAAQAAQAAQQAAAAQAVAAAAQRDKQSAGSKALADATRAQLSANSYTSSQVDNYKKTGNVVGGFNMGGPISGHYEDGGMMYGSYANGGGVAVAKSITDEEEDALLQQQRAAAANAQPGQSVLGQAAGQAKSMLISAALSSIFPGLPIGNKGGKVTKGLMGNTVPAEATGPLSSIKSRKKKVNGQRSSEQAMEMAFDNQSMRGPLA